MKSTTKLSKKQQVQLLKDIHKILEDVFDTISWGQYYKSYFNENLREEKRHRRWKPDNIPEGISVKEGAIYFSVSQIIKYLLGAEEKPKVEDYLFFRRSCYTAYALVNNHKQAIKGALKDYPIASILNIDYCYLIQHGNNGNKLY